MCGFAGIVRLDASGVEEHLLARMGGAIRHRGPDGFGLHAGSRVGLVHVRLSILDLSGGAQPMANEDGGVIVVFNGEIFNHTDLRTELRGLGHVFASQSDTEVLVHGWEEWGTALFHRLNGQFAFAIYDRRDESVTLVRDRFGVRPLFHATTARGDLVFGSEMKAIFASDEITPAADPAGLDELFTMWGCRPPRTPFLGVSQLEPGTWQRCAAGHITRGRYFSLDYETEPVDHRDILGELDALLRSSVDLRMRADVPVGAYLSGGLDSAIIASLASEGSPHTLRTFSIAFEDPRYDERAQQQLMATTIGSRHVMATVGAETIAHALPDVIRHTEVPLLRTAPVPMYHLARVTREAGIKVVLTGEGSDELFLGYDIFRESEVRRFCRRQPQSTVRPRLFDRLYPYMRPARGGGDFWSRFFLEACPDDEPLFSHMPRFMLSQRIREFYSPGFRTALADADPFAALRASLPARWPAWTQLHRAAYLEMVSLLSPYLLSAQGDRVSLAFGVEGRYPFLDPRLEYFAATLPETLKTRGLNDKVILREWAEEKLPPVIARRPKQPYRAPDSAPFRTPAGRVLLDDLLGPRALSATGYFEPSIVDGLVKRVLADRPLGTREEQALVAIVTTQLWHRAFLNSRREIESLDPGEADIFWRDPVTA